jgi:hypothetical protein
MSKKDVDWLILNFLQLFFLGVGILMMVAGTVWAVKFGKFGWSQVPTGSTVLFFSGLVSVFLPIILLVLARPSIEPWEHSS